VNSILAERTETDEKLIRVSSDMDEFEGYEAGQAHRVAWIADLLGGAFNLASRDRFFLEQAALVHDIGEVVMNRHYIRAATGLTMKQRIDLERHPVIGEQEAARLGLPRGVQLIVRWHHEWWNGTGYPDGIEQEQIPLAARILRVADTFGAMTATRPFRTKLSADDGKKYLREWAGIEFDPLVVKTFLSIALPSEPTHAVKPADAFGNGTSFSSR
jgi:HD-GYP domain-containing protein (c-di-GMP phosphodiesterase class II)